MKSKKTLDSFVKYCYENPNLRFWQALRNWSKFDFIYGKTINHNDKLAWNKYMDFVENTEDTFYFEGKDK